jgi:TonB-dependent starch-binding outer membrane protein SusC
LIQIYQWYNFCSIIYDLEKIIFPVRQIFLTFDLKAILNQPAMKTKILLALILLIVIAPNQLSAQKGSRKITIKGRVLDASKSPVANAIIMIDGQSTNSVTDTKGNYKIKVKRDAREIGAFTIDMGIIQEAIDGRSMIDFNFSLMLTRVSSRGNKSDKGEETVDVGYSYVKKKDLTNAVGVFEFKDPKRTYSSVYEMIQEIPGINMKVYNMYGPVGPLYVINGVAGGDISAIEPSDVESIVFLKDAAAAIYGSRAFGGVVLIKTRVHAE